MQREDATNDFDLAKGKCHASSIAKETRSRRRRDLLARGAIGGKNTLLRAAQSLLTIVCTLFRMLLCVFL